MKDIKKPLRRNWCPFKEARVFTHGLGLKNKTEWATWAKSDMRPDDIPATPSEVYKDRGWANWGDWLGTQNRRGGYRQFQEARTFAHNLGLKSVVEWGVWAKSYARPSDIPADPINAYKSKGWAGWRDWLAISQRIQKTRIYRSFNDARMFVHSLGFKNRAEWNRWSKISDRPLDIPSNPQKTYRDNGWISWGDWLGTGFVVASKRKYLPFNEARAFARTLGMKNKDEWREWAKTKAKLNNIPSNPQGTYKDKGWTNWGDWLGTDYVANQNRSYLTFEEARAFVRSLGLKNQGEWKYWSRSGAKPEKIPTNPHNVYKGQGWTSVGDWLGTRNRKGGYRPFKEALAFVHDLGLQSRTEWEVWAKSDTRSVDIPSAPRDYYQNKGWVSWGDWLGTGSIAPKDRIYRPFEEARAFVRRLGLQGKDEWGAWASSDARPDDIPSGPSRTYRDEGWAGWGDWLGVVNLWNKNAILGFLNGIKFVLRDLQPAELYAIMRQNGMIASSKNATNTNAPLIKSIRDLCSSPNPEADFEKLIAEIEEENELLDEDLPEEQIADIDFIETPNVEELPALRSLAALKAIDELVQAGVTSDEETIEFLIANRVSGLWQTVLNDREAINLEQLRNENGGMHFETIRNRFLTQYDGAQSLTLPRGYDFRVEGKVAQPNLMQRLAAYRIHTERRLGNWSGVGAGKTLSAILASRTIDSRLTVIVAFNSTIKPWADRVKETFPDSVVHLKERGGIRLDPTKHTYLILNFETFQQPYSVAMVEQLVAKHKIDFVVLDEIQSVKQRTPKVASKRRQVVSGLLSSASEKNPDLCVLGMSATPVINNLFEAKALLEMVKGVSFEELETFSNIPNAIAMHEKLILYGIRYRPQYAQTIETEIKDIQGGDYLPQLARIRKGAILELERVLLDAKIETIIAALKKGTLVYTHYLTGLVIPLRQAIEKAGFKVGVFTGDDKSGLKLFTAGKVDVLIGSAPVGTGVDGLQYVCNRMIVVSLPWTSAEYEQLIGRLYRQGSVFEKVEVIVPQVILEHNGDIWSWDKMRMNRIQYKKTLADAAMDGVIPEGELSSPDTMFKKAREALQAWITRIEQDGVAIIERAQLRVPLPKETAHIIQRRFGDLSVMNGRFNTSYSQTTHERLQTNPEEWYLYHTLYREARKEWAEIPFEKIAKSLKKRPDWIIGDFGCGEAKLAELLPNKVHSFDHVALNAKVTACDITHVPLEDSALDVAVFSLSLMGLNYADYLQEAYRTLKFGGLLKIAEPINRWAEKRSELLSKITEAGFLLVGDVVESNQFLYIDAIKTAE